MEIKLLCVCGAKYKFDVEPVGGVMPWPVTCPVCHADGTAQANVILQQTFGAPVSAAAPPTEIAAPPPGRAPLPTASIAPPAAPAPVTATRFNRPQAAPPASPPPEAPMETETYTPPPRRTMAAAPEPEESESKGGKLAAVGMMLLVVVVIGFGVWKFGRKWYNRISAAVEVAQVLGSSSADDSEDLKVNLAYEDAVVLYIKQTNHTAVAEACQSYWKEKLHKDLALITVKGDQGMANGEYELVPAHNGWVRIIGDLEWKAPQYEAVAQYLSQKLDTLVFETSDVDFTGAYHFGVYDGGAKKFHAKMEIINADADGVVTTEGNDWALANGFKPREEGFKDFHIGDADDITQKLGMKLWDEDFETITPTLVLKERGGRP